MKAYIVNERSNVVHKAPTREECNMDQVPRKFRRTFHGPLAKQFKLCGHCFGKKK